MSVGGGITQNPSAEQQLEEVLISADGNAWTWDWWNYETPPTESYSTPMDDAPETFVSLPADQLIAQALPIGVVDSPVEIINVVPKIEQLTGVAANESSFIPKIATGLGELLSRVSAGIGALWPTTLGQSDLAIKAAPLEEVVVTAPAKDVGTFDVPTPFEIPTPEPLEEVFITGYPVEEPLNSEEYLPRWTQPSDLPIVRTSPESTPAPQTKIISNPLIEAMNNPMIEAMLSPMLNALPSPSLATALPMPITSPFLSSLLPLELPFNLPSIPASSPLQLIPNIASQALGQLPLNALVPSLAPLEEAETDPCKKCKAKEKEKRKKRSSRSVCYRGTYIERSKGLIKSRKEQIPCQ